MIVLRKLTGLWSQTDSDLYPSQPATQKPFNLGASVSPPVKWRSYCTSEDYSENDMEGKPFEAP